MRDPFARHAADVAAIRTLASLVDPRTVGRAFVASLTSRKLEYRSALASYAFARTLPDHGLDSREGTYATICRACSWSLMPTEAEEQPSERLEAERVRFGGVRQGDPEYVLYDLTAFKAMPSLEPTAADWQALRLILRTPGLLAPESKPSDLQKALKNVVPSNKDERTMLIRSLSFVGVLQPASHPTFFQGYIPPDAQSLPPVRFADWGYPTIWWRAKDGVNTQAVEYWFPELGAE